MLWKINFHKWNWIMKIRNLKLDINKDYGWITLYFVHELKLFIHNCIYLFVLTFWSFRKDGLIINLKLISKLIASQPGSQTVIIQVLPNISRRKGNQTTKLGQVIVYNKKNKFFFKIHAENEIRKLVLDFFSFFFFEKSFIWCKSKWYAT